MYRILLPAHLFHIDVKRVYFSGCQELDTPDTSSLKTRGLHCSSESQFSAFCPFSDSYYYHRNVDHGQDFQAHISIDIQSKYCEYCKAVSILVVIFNCLDN